MGAMLWQYHDKPAAKVAEPDLEPGTLAQTGQTLEQTEQANEAKLHDAQQEQVDAANEHPDTIAATPEASDPPADSVHPVIQEAGAEAADPTPLSEAEPAVEHVVGEPADGEEITPENAAVVEQVTLTEREADLKASGLTRGSSTADWVAYDQGEHGDKTGLDKRDALAEHYLGAK